MTFRLTIDKALCKGCALCAAVCPAHVLRMSQTLDVHGNPCAEPAPDKVCVGCQMCALICPDAAIKIQRIE